MTTLLSIGECMVEMAPTEDGTYAMGFAGDTFNTAWYARRLAAPGLEVGYFSAVGDDAVSDRMTAFMRNAGVDARLVVRPGGTVGLYMISLSNGERSFSYWRSTAAARSMADDLEALPGLGSGDMAFFSGISIAILPETGRRRLLDVLADARESGVRVAFDPNLRPRLWASNEEMCHWITEAGKVADISLPSYEDEASFFGDADQMATAKRYADLGAGLVITKDGPDPVLILQGGQTTSVAPETVAKVVDTTAAGDSFNAGFLTSLLDRADPGTATRRACKVSAQVVTRRGALVEIDPV